MKPGTRVLYTADAHCLGTTGSPGFGGVNGPSVVVHWDNGTSTDVRVANLVDVSATLAMALVDGSLAKACEVYRRRGFAPAEALRFAQAEVAYPGDNDPADSTIPF